MRSLGPEEEALWARVTATIRPLSRKLTPASEDASQAPKEGKQAQPRPIHHSPQAAPKQSARRPSTLSGATLDSSWDRRLRSGRVEPDRVLDLHGLSLDGAWEAIDRGLERSIAVGDRVLLLVTGHERPGEPPVRRGKIRAAVHDWLAASRHARAIAAVRSAHRRHGGGGSLYIILRRNASHSTFS